MKPDVLLLSAGFGSRLRPLTDTCPKPLIPVAGKPLLVWNLELLARSGFSRVFINLHYLGEMIREFVGDGSTWGLHVEYSDEPLLLDTGGAIKAIESRLQSGLLLTLNSDILVDAAFPFRGSPPFPYQPPAASGGHAGAANGCRRRSIRIV